MKKIIKILIILLLFILFAYVFNIWAENSPRFGDYRAIHDRDSEIDLAFAFATALRINHFEAYEMIDQSLKPRLDEWMNFHESKKCISAADYSFISDGSHVGKKITLGCFIETSYLSYEVDDIVIKDMKVIDWGEVREGN